MGGWHRVPVRAGMDKRQWRRWRRRTASRLARAEALVGRTVIWRDYEWTVIDNVNDCPCLIRVNEYDRVVQAYSTSYELGGMPVAPGVLV